MSSSNSVTSESARELRMECEQYKRDKSDRAVDSNQEVASLTDLIDNNRITRSVEFFPSVSSYRSSSSRVGIRQVIRRDSITAIKPQMLGVNALQFAGSGAFAYLHGTSDLPSTRSSSRPSTYFSVNREDEQGQSRLNSFDRSPTQGVGIERINDGQTFIKKDDFWSSQTDSSQNDKKQRPERCIDGVVFASSEPLTRGDSNQKKIESTQYPVIAGGPKNFGVSAIAFADHVAIVSQKVENS